jgi:hypothetical protein
MNRTTLKRILMFSIIVVLFSLFYNSSFSQCAMCKATAEDAKDDSARGLNYAIMYLLVIPYLLIAAIGYWWYVKNKKNAGEENKEL